MRKLSKRTVAGILSLSIMLPLGIPTFAASQPQYSISIQKNTLRIMNGTKVYRSYPMENTQIRLMRSVKDNLLVGFTKKNARKTTNLVVGAQDFVTITGEMTSLDLAQSLPSNWEVLVDGTVQTMTVDANVQTILAKDAQIAHLKINHKQANVCAVNGSEIEKTTAVTGAAVKNIKKYTGGSDYKTQDLSKTPKKKTYVDFEDRDEQKYTRSTGFDTNAVILEARSGYSVGSAIRDVKMTVYDNENNNRKVSGMWEFVSASDADETKDGIYRYRFIPYEKERYETKEIQIHFTGSGQTRGLKRPDLQFEDRSHGDGNFWIEVALPSTVEDDDELYIYITDPNKNRIEEQYSLSRSDAGEKESYHLHVNGVSGDQFKIKVKIKRSHGSDSPYSKSITYEID